MTPDINLEDRRIRKKTSKTWQSEIFITTDERGSKAVRKSVFDCKLSPKTLFLMAFDPS